MNHIALIIAAESDSGAPVGVPFLLPALRAVAASCCGAVEEIQGTELAQKIKALAENTVCLVLDANHPLVTAEDAQALLDAAESGIAAVRGKGNANGFPAAFCGIGKKEKEISLSEDASFAVSDASSLARALKILRQRKNDALMAEGVLLLDPKRTYIDPDVRIGAGTVVHPGNTITGASVVGADCVLLPNNRIHASNVGNGVTVENSVLTECSIGNRTTVGPFAYLRPGTNVGEGCRIGDFVEIKNSNIGDLTRISHLTYVGDGDLGRNINLGCGVVFVNYDGKEKRRTAVEDDAFIGCNTNLVAPVRVGRAAYVAAGATITEDVPGDALAIARARQVNKEGWVAKRREEGKI